MSYQPGSPSGGAPPGYTGDSGAAGYGGGGGLGLTPEEIAALAAGGAGGAGDSVTEDEAMRAVLNNLKVLGKYRKWLGAIKQAASYEHVDPAVLAAILGHTPEKKVTAQMIRQAARGLAQSFRATGTVNGAARDMLGANVNIQALLPGKYTPHFGAIRKGPAPKKTPEQQVAESIYKSDLRAGLTDPWVVLKRGKNGKLQLGFSFTPNPPKRVVKGFSLPVRRSEFMSAWGHYNDIYEAYVGRKAKAGEVATILRKGLSDWSLQNTLSKSKAFTRSRIWKANEPALRGVGLDILGSGAWGAIPAAERNNLIRRAIVEDWSGDTFAETLRARPEYLDGTEFQGNVASLSNVYQQIYGMPNAGSGITIREAALARWSPDQFAAYLRQSPNYTSSPEYLSRAYSVLETLGSIVGAIPGLSPGAAPANIAPNFISGVPNDTRIPGAPSAPTSPFGNLVPSF